MVQFRNTLITQWTILTNPFRQIPWILGSEIPGFSMISLDFKENSLILIIITILVVKINI